jgi:hypothetical protein
MMKVKKLASVVAMGLLAAGAVAHADIQVKFAGTSPANADVCDRLAGAWKGDGHVSAFLLSCSYTGAGEVVNLGGGQYTVHVDLKTSSGWPCRDMNTILPATCHNGNIQIQTNDVQLSGTTDGNTASFRDGSITFSGITANIDYINLTR